MAKPYLAQNTLQLHFPCEQMELALAQIVLQLQTIIYDIEMI